MAPGRPTSASTIICFPISACLPQWLTDPGHSPAVTSVKLAEAVLNGEAPLPDAAEIDLEASIGMIESEMAAAAEAMDFERAALLRDQLFECRARLEGKKPGRKNSDQH